MKFVFKKMNKKGFSLIELIVVIAILAIIAAVAIPRFAGIQARSEVKSDAATASEIVNAARVYYVDTGNNPANIAALTTAGYLPSIQAQSTTVATDAAGGFVLSGTGATSYTVNWTPANGSTADTQAQTVTENTPYVYTPKP
ncbi:MAG: prepilin-type N-terminal cleavage/methylation domain-containing protein [Clostridia bacterium]|nr:prepilin-type N-terminal cleavage/methylation domain-containing protein [Clostridia bacterium]